jgi:hypothetical protein
MSYESLKMGMVFAIRSSQQCKAFHSVLETYAALPLAQGTQSCLKCTEWIGVKAKGWWLKRARQTNTIKY